MSQCAIAYLRVSTERQGRSGLGIEAQRVRVRHFADSEGFELIGEEIEIKTGKGADALDRRPRLAAALAKARRARCPVIVTKLDRLSRDVAFIAGMVAERLPSSSPNSAVTPVPPAGHPCLSGASSSN